MEVTMLIHMPFFSQIQNTIGVFDIFIASQCFAVEQWIS